MSRIEQGTQNTEAVSFDRINERLVRTFRGEPTQRSARRELLRNWADLYSGVEVAGTTVEAPAQLATVLPEQLTSGFDAVDQQITAAQLSETEIAEATEAAQQALAWSTKPENSGRQFNFGFLRTEAMKQVASLLFAVLFMLGTVMTACAAGETNAQDSTNAAGAPTTTIESGNNPIQGGGDENEPTYQTFATFKKDANVRSGAGTNFGVAYTGSQGEMLPVTGATKKDTSGKVWREVIIITEAGKPKVTGWVREDLVTISEQVVEETSGGIGTPEITAEQEAATIAALNAISTTTGIGLVEFMHPGDETVAITTTTGITTEAQLTYYLTRLATDGANQELVAAIVVLNNEGGQVVLVPATQDTNPGNGGRTLIGPVVARVDIEGAWVPEQQGATNMDTSTDNQDNVQTIEAEVRKSLPANFEEYYKTEYGATTITFDENAQLFFFEVIEKGEKVKKYIIPMAAGRPSEEGDLKYGVFNMDYDGASTIKSSDGSITISYGINDRFLSPDKPNNESAYNIDEVYRNHADQIAEIFRKQEPEVFAPGKKTTIFLLISGEESKAWAARGTEWGYLHTEYGSTRLYIEEDKNTGETHVTAMVFFSEDKLRKLISETYLYDPKTGNEHPAGRQEYAKSALGALVWSSVFPVLQPTLELDSKPSSQAATDRLERTKLYAKDAGFLYCNTMLNGDAACKSLTDGTKFNDHEQKVKDLFPLPLPYGVVVLSQSQIDNLIHNN